MSDDRPQNAQNMAAGLDRLLASIGGANARGLPPVERWNPPFCGDIDMRIAADGRWFYMGTPIARPALVKLFASVLKREGDHHVLVTPAEKVGIQVEDAPFMAVDMGIDGEGDSARLSFRTNVDDVVSADADHPLRFETEPGGGLKPYLHVRRGLWAKLSRPLLYDLVALAQPKADDAVGDDGQRRGEPEFGVWSGGVFFPIASAGSVEGLT